MRFLTGTVYSKALAIFLAAALGLLGAVAALTQLIILREFHRSEQREMKSMLQRFSYVLARESKPLSESVGDWGSSADLASYLDGNPTTNLNLESIIRFGRSGIDFVVVYDRTGALIEILERESGLIVSRSELTDALERFEVGNRSSDQVDTGFVMVGDTLCAIAFCGVQAEGSPGESGLIVGGRLMNEDAWGFLEGLFSANISFETFRNARINESNGRVIAELLNATEVVIDAEADSQITGYRLISGLDGLPLGYISVSQARLLREEGLHAIQIFLTGICLAGGALVLVVWFLLDRTILARIKDLTQKLDLEKRSGRLPVRLNFRGEDELGALAKSIEGLALLLQRTQSLYRAVLEDQTELICRFDPNFRLTFANAVFLRFFHLDELSMRERRLQDFVPEEAWRLIDREFQKLSREKILETFSHDIRFGEGRGFWFRSTVRKNFLPDGSLDGGQLVMAEISAQVGAQRKMIDSERRFRRIFESASDGLLLVDAKSLIISDINFGLCQMLMVTGSDVIGRRMDQLPVLGSCLEAVRSYQPNEAVIRPGFRKECRLQRGDETSLFVELRVAGYEVDGRDFVQLSFRNISERILGEKELRRLSVKLLRLQDDERRRIARELHDSTAQNLSALEMNMSMLQTLMPASDGRAARLVADTRQIASECSRELRNISYLLHPPLIDEVGPAFAIRWFADGFSKRTGISATVDISEDFPRLATDLEMPLFRIVQEAMTNVYRHSGADHVWVTLKYEQRIVQLEVRDNGRGFKEGILVAEAERDGGVGVGLAGMKERLANVGGELEIESSPLGVTLSIRVAVGMHDAEAEADANIEHPTSNIES